MKQIIAIGGGGFGSHPSNLLIHQYILNQAQKESPKICFLPQASSEARDYIVNFYQTFCNLGAQPSWVSLFGRVSPSWRNHILSQDIIFVGGGNTRSMLALWREWGMDEVLREAYDRGIILSGTSAGAICWFEQGITDSGPVRRSPGEDGPLGVLDGLGILKGSCCPHYDDEAERRPSYIKFTKSGEAVAGIALAEEAAAHFVDGTLHKIVAAKKGKQCYQVSAHGEQELEVHYLG
jgi:dipeptidase E